MTRTIAAILVAITLSLTGSTTALATQGTTVHIQQKAFLGATPFFGGTVTVVLKVAGTGFCNANVQLSQTSITGSVFGFGSRGFVGTGQMDEVAVTVTSFGPPFDVGDAQALVQVFCFEGPAADTRTINITP